MQQTAEATSSPAVSAFLTQGEAAHYLRVSPRTLEDWRLKGGGPAFVKMSRRCVRYRRESLDAFAVAREVTSTTEADAAAL